MPGRVLSRKELLVHLILSSTFVGTGAIVTLFSVKLIEEHHSAVNAVRRLNSAMRDLTIENQNHTSHPSISVRDSLSFFLQR